MKQTALRNFKRLMYNSEDYSRRELEIEVSLI